MVTKPLVSIIIPVYNGSNYLREAIDSALAQTYKNIEIIVINDGSNDGGATRNIALSYGNRIRYYEKDNGGVSTALNLGIKVMNGTFFSWLSHDDMYYPQKVEREIQAIKNSGDDILVYSAYDVLYMADGRTEHRKAIYDKKYMNSMLFAVIRNIISGCSLMIPKKLFVKYGYFDENQKTVQDYKKWFQFRHEPVLYIDEPLITVRIHNQQGSVTMPECEPEQVELFRSFADDLTIEDAKKIGLSRFAILENCVVTHCNNRFFYEKFMQEEEPDNIADCNKIVFDKIKKITNYKTDSIYIYCAGKMGKLLLLELIARNIKVDGFSDSDINKVGKYYMNVPCISRKLLPKDACIIVSKNSPEDVVKDLMNEGFENVISYDNLKEMLLENPFAKKYAEMFVR